MAEQWKVPPNVLLFIEDDVGVRGSMEAHLKQAFAAEGKEPEFELFFPESAARLTQVLDELPLDGRSIDRLILDGNLWEGKSWRDWAVQLKDLLNPDQQAVVILIASEQAMIDAAADYFAPHAREVVKMPKVFRASMLVGTLLAYPRAT